MNKYFYDRKSETFFEFEETECLENPRKDVGYDSTFITFERNYYSPDKNPFENWEEMMKHFKTEFTGNRKKDLESLQVNALKHGFVLMPVWKYEHSGRTYAAADRNPFPDDGWDSGVCGVIYEKRNRRNIEVVRNALKNQVKEHHRYVNNEGIFIISQYDKNGDVLDMIDQVWAADDWNEDKLAILIWEYFNDVDLPIYVGEFESLNDAKLTEDKIEALYKEKEEVKAEPLSVTVSLAQRRCGNQNTDSISKETIEYNR